MKKLFSPKPINKAEALYLQQLANRPPGTIFREVFSKAQNIGVIK
jgi:hypothetical protein